MRIFVQIPCLNEAETLPMTLDALPESAAGRPVEVLVIDDGSTDDTAQVARDHGVQHVVRHQQNRGLAAAFMTGLVSCVERGADIIVNLDADNQYDAGAIERLVTPVLEGRADIVVGSRPIADIQHFSPVKKWLQFLGSSVVRALSGTPVRDAPSGFRAFSADAALRLNVFSTYTYTLETLIQAGHSNLRVLDVPVDVNPPTRSSRLIRSIPSYIRRSARDLLRTYAIYRPTSMFNVLGAALLIPSMVLAARYLGFHFSGEGAGHVQSVIVAGALGAASVFMFAIGAVAHLIGINRRLLEEVRFLTRRADVAGRRPQEPESAPGSPDDPTEPSG